MKVPPRFNPILAAAFLAGLLSAPPAGAQDADEPMFLAGGTVVPQHNETDWAFLSWLATDLDLLADPLFGIYAKPGEPDTPGAYERLALLRPADDPSTVGAFLQRSLRLGADLADLESRIDALFVDLLPAADLTLAQKLAAVIQVAHADPEILENLVLLGRIHPGVAMALGLAWTGPFPGAKTATWEIRRLDPATREALQVIGRISLNEGVVRRLPAPGAPVQVPAEDARGHLNILLRWATPDDLRRLSLLHYGFNVWRVERGFADGEGLPVDAWETGAADEPGTLLWYAEQYPEAVVRANRLPVLPDQILDAAEAMDFSSSPYDPEAPEPVFFADDNRRFDDGTAFENGQQFFYFVTARDLLGRDGAISPGTLMTACDRLPPSVPVGLEVRNRYDPETDEPYLEVSWRVNPEPDGEESPTTRYHVYRWESLEQLYAHAGDPLFNLVSVHPVEHDPAAGRLRFADRGADAPAYPADATRTFYYTVRAEDAGACGSNLSGHSGPMWGVLREWAGPEAPEGTVAVNCEEVRVEFLGTSGIGNPELSRERGFYALPLIINIEDPEVAWFEVAWNSSDQVLARVSVVAPAVPYLYIVRIPIEGVDAKDADGTLLLRAGSHHGTVSPWVFGVRFNPVLAQSVLAHLWRIRVDYGGTFAPLTDCGRHISRIDVPGESGKEIVCVQGSLSLAERSREWKVYRRVNDGTLMLIAQGVRETGEPGAVGWEDCVLPGPAFTTICYYAQAFDEHGNPSPLVRIDCIEAIHSDFPIPMLASPEAVDGAPEGTTRLRWFSPRAGIDRFEVWVSAETGQPADDLQGNLSPNLADPIIAADGAGVRDVQWKVYQSPRLEAGYGEGPEFSAAVVLEPGMQYRFKVRAVARGGFLERAAGPFSNEQSWSWTEPPPPDLDEVPWPDRELPGVIPASSLSAKIRFDLIPPAYGGGIGIRVGEAPVIPGLQPQDPNEPQADGGIFPLPTTQPPLNYLYQFDGLSPGMVTGEGRSLLPMVIYRYQVPTASQPNVPGDLIQVSPLLEDIAYLDRPFGDAGDYNVVIDPYFTGVPDPERPDRLIIYARDTQPVLFGEAYRYLLVRFRPDGEIDRVITTQTLNLSSP
ncbi:MAG: hypothetical protein EA425_02605 [Puniceicoccaceae bacterium]|nr:MAG: hypothetical protein EA425_02605 [Puniceicoccaceae bacterium]